MRKVNALLGATLVLLLVPHLNADEPKMLKFSKADLGKAPADWTVTQTGKGQGSIWKIVEDSTAPSKSGLALAQTAESPSAVFNVCVAKDTSYGPSHKNCNRLTLTRG